MECVYLVQEREERKRRRDGKQREKWEKHILKEDEGGSWREIERARGG